jgi:hypothetical protein
VRIGRSLIVTLVLAAGALVVVGALVAPALASSDVCAGIVIDDGNGAAPLQQGASVPAGSSDLDLLNSAGDTFTQNDSGLVCAINDYPANGLQNCLKTSHGLYYYWSYWEGDPTTNTWTYADVGPAEHTVEADQPYVEGWRYQDPGPDSPAATPPSVKPALAFAEACQSEPTTTTGASPPSTDESVTTTTPSPTATTTATTTSVVPKTSSTTANTSTSVVGQPTSPTTTRSTHATGGTSRRNASRLPASTRSTSHVTPGSSFTSQPRASALPLAHQGGSRGSGGDPAVPVLVAVAIFGILATVAWLRWRRPAAE